MSYGSNMFDFWVYQSEISALSFRTVHRQYSMCLPWIQQKLIPGIFLEDEDYEKNL